METRPGLETQDYGDSQSKINQGTELFSIFFFSLNGSLFIRLIWPRALQQLHFFPMGFAARPKTRTETGHGSQTPQKGS